MKILVDKLPENSKECPFALHCFGNENAYPICKLKYKNYEKALKLGISSATATVSTIYLGTKEEILEYFNKI